MVSAEVFTGGPGDDIEATINTLQPGDDRAFGRDVHVERAVLVMQRQALQ